MSEGPRVAKNIKMENKEYFAMNGRSLTMQMVCDAFKAYIQGILIALKSGKRKAQNEIRNELIQKISNLELVNKQVPSGERADEIFQIYHQLKMIAALEIAQSIMYAKQNVFKNRDKAGK